MLGRYLYPFHLPPELLQVLLPSWGDPERAQPEGQSSLFQGAKQLGNRARHGRNRQPLLGAAKPTRK